MNKSGMVNRIFTSVAGSYDLMNDLMSCGLHRLWKRELVDRLGLPSLGPGIKALDVAGGTGDVAIRIVRSGTGAAVWVCDSNVKMLERGRNRAINAGIVKGVHWICAEAERLPFAENSFDIYTVSFGLRNTYDLKASIKEAFRVLRPGSRFASLEFFPEVDGEYFGRAYNFYLSNIIPKMGEKITGDYEAYQYLSDSIKSFHPTESIKSFLEDQGFEGVEIIKLCSGVAAIHLAKKPE